MSAWSLSRAAEEDLIGLWIEGAGTFGAAQADRYQDGLVSAFALLATFPEMTRGRHELRPPLRVHPHGAHLILDLVRSDGDVFVVRVQHRHEDWTTEPV